MEENSKYLCLDEGLEYPNRIHELEEVFRECFDENKFNIVLDLAKITVAPGKFIVALIEATSQARRLGGDILLKNLNSAIRNNLVTFSSRTYLSIETSEKYALQDFGETFDNHPEFDISEKPVNLVLKDSSATIKLTEKATRKLDEKQDNHDDAIRLAHEKIQVQSTAENLYEICDFVLDRAEQAGFDVRERGKIKVTVYEACLNVVEHAYFSNPDHWIHVYVGFDDQRFVIVIQDWGESFEFDPTRPYDVEQAVKDRRTGGFGLHIIRRSVDEISYRSDPDEGNRLILVKYI
jgi:serine/threonine-protein kinase RsbW